METTKVIQMKKAKAVRRKNTRVARNQKVNISNESSEIKAKKEKTAKERTKRGENHGIEMARKERIGEEVGTKKAKRKESIVVNTIEQKAQRVSKMA